MANKEWVRPSYVDRTLVSDDLEPTPGPRCINCYYVRVGIKAVLQLRCERHDQSTIPDYSCSDFTPDPNAEF